MNMDVDMSTDMKMNMNKNVDMIVGYNIESGPTQYYYLQVPLQSFPFLLKLKSKVHFGPGKQSQTRECKHHRKQETGMEVKREE